MKKIFQPAVLIGLLAIFGVPLFALAQGINLSVITPYSTSITSLINDILVPVLMAIAFIVFLWGVYKYFIQGAADEKSRADGRQFALWGIIGFVIILSLWGLVNLFTSMLGLTANNAPAFPTIGTGTSGVTNNSTGVTLPTSGGTQVGGTSATQTVVQTQAVSALNAQAQSQQAICAQYGAKSAQCQSATDSYNAALTNYLNQYPSSGVQTGVGGSCTSDAGCGSNLVCSQGTCVHPITSNGCAAGYALGESGGCERVSAGSVKQGGGCSVNADCSGTLTCQQGFCATTVDSSTGCADGLVIGENGGCVSPSEVGGAGASNACSDPDASNYGSVGACTYSAPTTNTTNGSSDDSNQQEPESNTGY